MKVALFVNKNVETAVSVEETHFETFATALPKESLLLVEADAEPRSRHSRLLSGVGYRVAAVSGYREILALRPQAIQLAVLSDSLCPAYLRLTAENVRRRWPLARILVIGAAHAMLADHLYEDSIDRLANDEELLVRVSDLSICSARYVSWSALASKLEADIPDAPQTRYRSVPVESDPSKAPHDEANERPEPDDLPAEERRDWRPQN